MLDPIIGSFEVSGHEFKVSAISTILHFSPALENSLGTNKGQADGKVTTVSPHAVTIAAA